MMTTNIDIRNTAFYYFSEYGYEGTSLSQIARKVGVKTPSLYAHYKSKEDIFFSCLEYALESDKLFFHEQVVLRKDVSVKENLYKFLLEYGERLESNSASLFCLRALYSPPHAFKKRLFIETNSLVEYLGILLTPLFEESQKNGELKSKKINYIVEAYLCLFDGLIIEFLYAGRDRFQYRLEAAWEVFLSGVFVSVD